MPRCVLGPARSLSGRAARLAIGAGRAAVRRRPADAGPGPVRRPGAAPVGRRGAAFRRQPAESERPPPKPRWPSRACRWPKPPAASSASPARRRPKPGHARPPPGPTNIQPSPPPVRAPRWPGPASPAPASRPRQPRAGRVPAPRARHLLAHRLATRWRCASPSRWPRPAAQPGGRRRRRGDRDRGGPWIGPATSCSSTGSRPPTSCSPPSALRHRRGPPPPGQRQRGPSPTRPGASASAHSKPCCGPRRRLRRRCRAAARRSRLRPGPRLARLPGMEPSNDPPHPDTARRRLGGPVVPPPPRPPTKAAITAPPKPPRRRLGPPPPPAAATSTWSPCWPAASWCCGWTVPATTPTDRCRHRGRIRPLEGASRRHRGRQPAPARRAAHHAGPPRADLHRAGRRRDGPAAGHPGGAECRDSSPLAPEAATAAGSSSAGWPWRCSAPGLAGATAVRAGRRGGGVMKPVCKEHCHAVVGRHRSRGRCAYRRSCSPHTDAVSRIQFPPAGRAAAAAAGVCEPGRMLAPDNAADDGYHAAATGQPAGARLPGCRPAGRLPGLLLCASPAFAHTKLRRPRRRCCAAATDAPRRLADGRVMLANRPAAQLYAAHPVSACSKTPRRPSSCPASGGRPLGGRTGAGALCRHRRGPAPRPALPGQAVKAGEWAWLRPSVAPMERSAPRRAGRRGRPPPWPPARPAWPSWRAAWRRDIDAARPRPTAARQHAALGTALGRRGARRRQTVVAAGLVLAGQRVGAGNELFRGGPPRLPDGRGAGLRPGHRRRHGRGVQQRGRCRAALCWRRRDRGRYAAAAVPRGGRAAAGRASW